MTSPANPPAQAADLLPSAVLLVSADGVISYMNTAAETLFEQSARRLTGEHLVHAGPWGVAAAGMAQIEAAMFQAVAKADALIKNEAFALPKAVGFGHVFQIFQDAALQVIDILDPLRD